MSDCISKIATRYWGPNHEFDQRIKFQAVSWRKEGYQFIARYQDMIICGVVKFVDNEEVRIRDVQNLGGLWN